MLVSLGVTVQQPVFEKQHRCYMTWVYGKPPDLAIEVVSNGDGGELSDKLRKYEQLRITHYVVYDPQCLLSSSPLHHFVLSGGELVATGDLFMKTLGLGLTVWEAEFEGLVAAWLRFTDEHGVLLPLPSERAAEATQRAQQETQRAQQEAQRAQQETQRANDAEAQLARLRAQLRAAGLEPDAE